MTGDEAGEDALRVSLLHGQETTVTTLSWRMHPDRTYSIDLDGPDGPVVGSGSDLFRALQEIRLELEPRGWLIAVQGARKDTYPTGMMRDMIGARRVYVLRNGRKAVRQDLVYIFDEAPADSIGTVEEQNINYKEWRLSLKR